MYIYSTCVPSGIRFDFSAVYTISYVSTYKRKKKKFAKLGEKSDFIKKQSKVTQEKKKKSNKRCLRISKSFLGLFFSQHNVNDDNKIHHRLTVLKFAKFD